MDINTLVDRTLTDISGGVGDEEIIFTTDSGELFKLYHCQDCCESVNVEDVTGDMSDLIGSPILLAEESTSEDNPDDEEYRGESHTWTFYKLATKKGYVDIRWLGSSNGYYSESVDFCQL